MTNTEGVKYDAGKLRWSLLPWKSVREIVKVLTKAVETGKYPDHNWKKVADAKTRYYDAMHRHIEDWWIDGITKDHETGLHPLAHAGCCLLFLLWFEMKGESNV
jgi:hypothetical protein